MVQYATLARGVTTATGATMLVLAVVLVVVRVVVLVPGAGACPGAAAAACLLACLLAAAAAAGRDAAVGGTTGFERTETESTHHSLRAAWSRLFLIPPLDVRRMRLRHCYNYCYQCGVEEPAGEARAFWTGCGWDAVAQPA